MICFIALLCVALCCAVLCLLSCGTVSSVLFCCAALRGVHAALCSSVLSFDGPAMQLANWPFVDL